MQNYCGQIGHGIKTPAVQWDCGTVETVLTELETRQLSPAMFLLSQAPWKPCVSTTGALLKVATKCGDKIFPECH